ncbi:MAG: hypothetical protein IT318_03510 [Anaerolineales bacterium]|nr:hypothetical protein [Anaerolineales bacterium]
MFLGRLDPVASAFNAERQPRAGIVSLVRCPRTRALAGGEPASLGVPGGPTAILACKFLSVWAAEKR